MSEQPRADAKRFQAGIVVDAHVHSADYLPRFAFAAFRWFNRRTVPPSFFFGQLPSTGVDVIVVNAVGDWPVTVWWGRPPWLAIEEQLHRIREQAEQEHVTIATSARHVWQEFESHRKAVVLGLEGGDGIGLSLTRVDELFKMGVRILTPVHLKDNQIGTTCLPWQRYLGSLAPPRRREPGLTAFGRKLIRRMNSLGMIIDVSHSDTATLNDITEMTEQPIIASHSGARKIEEFERFLRDEEILAIAKTGGLVGLWPYRYKGHGTADFGDLMRHAHHIADLVGPAHLCLGTDINGVPGMMAGYRGERDVRLIAEHLSASGFGQNEIEGIMGGNFMRVFEQIQAG
jgi:microsomal dipeptidase-like Zn-dependent dipeptidase